MSCSISKLISDFLELRRRHRRIYLRTFLPICQEEKKEKRGGIFERMAHFSRLSILQ